MSGLGLHYVNDKPQWDLTSNSNIYGLSVSIRIFAILLEYFAVHMVKPETNNRLLEFFVMNPILSDLIIFVDKGYKIKLT